MADGAKVCYQATETRVKRGGEGYKAYHGALWCLFLPSASSVQNKTAVTRTLGDMKK